MQRDEAIKQLENLQLELYSEILQNASLHMAANEYYKRYTKHFKGLKAVEENFKKDILERTIYRYRNSGYDHTDTNSLVLEYNVWKFAQNNPEQWFIMTENIQHGHSEVNTYEGFSFMDHFIHNGIMDDWELFIVEKDSNVFFVNDGKEEHYKAEGYKVSYLSPKNMQNLIDTFNKPQKKLKM